MSRSPVPSPDAELVRTLRSIGRRGTLDKALYWRDYKLEHGPRAGIRIADELRRQAAAQRPGWPTRRDRELDRQTHLRVIDVLASVPSRGR